MFRIADSVLLALERLWQHRILVFWALAGLAAATVLALSLPLYVDSVNTGLLTANLAEPPYAVRLRYLGSWNGNITRADVTSTNAAMQRYFIPTVGLPAEREVRYVRGAAWSVRFADNRSLGPFSLGMLEGAEEQITIVSGEWPPEPVREGEPLPVLLPERMLYAMGVQVGDMLSITPPGGQPIRLRVAALWGAANSRDPAWIFPPKFFDDIFLMEPDTLWQALEGIEKPVEESAWFVVFDGRAVRTADVSGLIARFTDSRRSIEVVLPGIRMDLSPQDGLAAFNQQVNRLTQQLFIVILPVGGLVLYFVVLVAGLLVGRQQGEDVMLRSRGMSRRAILGTHALMWLILAGIALLVAALAAPSVVRLVGRTTSFLRFDDTLPALEVTFTWQALAAAVVTALLAASSGLFMAWRTSRQTITGFKQQAARATKAWWQRMYLDVLLLIPAYYVLYTLSQQGGLLARADDPFSDPLTFLGPTLFALGNTLLFLRLWPFFLRLGSNVVALGRGVALLMALRELTRRIGSYRGALLMVCFTLSLTGFTASMASTIDHSLKDAVDYRIGADSVMVVASDALIEEGQTADGEQTQTITGFNTLPASDLLNIDGVVQVSRVGRYPAQLRLSNQRVQGSVLGVDRAAMAAIVRFRPDYADEHIADLLNRLAGNRTGVLLSKAAALKYNLRIGEEITLEVQALNQWYPARVPIVGLLDFFPTLDPRDGFFAVTNLDPIWETVGTELPHDIWLSLAPGTNPAQVREAAYERGFPILQWLDPESALREAQAAPARRGVLGFLSVGFVASILLTLVGNIIQSAASFRAQSVQLGSLRAMGLGGAAVALYLLLAQGLSLFGGILGGTSVGVATTVLYLPLLDFSGGLPPYLMRVAWGDIVIIYALFAGVLLVVALSMTVMLGREQLAALIKLGGA